jgi:hypothetical protein
LAGKEDSPRDLIDKLTVEFALGIDQGQKVDFYLSQQGGAGYVLEKARMARSAPRKNIGAWFMKALVNDWKAPVSTKKPRLGAIQEPVEVPTDEDWERRRAAATMMKAAVTSAPGTLNLGHPVSGVHGVKYLCTPVAWGTGAIVVHGAADSNDFRAAFRVRIPVYLSLREHRI